MYKPHLTEPILSVRGLTKAFPFSSGWLNKKRSVQAVDHIDLDVFLGETLGIVGESGCGKSTLGYMITRLLEPTSGEIVFAGADLLQKKDEELRQARQQFQIIFQDPNSSLNPRMKVKDIIAEPLLVHNLYKGKKLMEEVNHLLEAVGLNSEHGERYPHEFSGGQKQRIVIARALALRPKLIVCDEPTSALDVSIQAQILNLLKDLQAQFDLTYIFISHGLPAVRYIADRVAVMYLGRIVEISKRTDLFSSPLHPYTEALLASVPVPNPEFKKERTLLKGDLPNPANPPQGCAFHTRCIYATERCKHERPELLQTASGRYVACHEPLQS